MIYDTKTKNRSFLVVSKQLREMNVKNNKFMLELYDPTIQGIDPHSDDLTSDQQVRILHEISINKWYFLREVVKIGAAGADISYALNLGNLTMAYLHLKNKNMIAVLPRQVGKTTAKVVDDVWTQFFVTRNSRALYMNKDISQVKDNLKRFKDVKDKLPKWILALMADKNDADNAETKYIAKRNNKIEMVGTASNPDDADKKGRGASAPIVFADEWAFMKYNDIIYAAFFPAWKKSADIAKEHGVPYGITITTTPNNRDSGPGAFAMEMIENATKFVPECFDMSDEELDNYLEANSINYFFYVEYKYYELGYDDEWLERVKRENNNDMKKIKREYLLEWPKSMELSVFSEEDIERLSTFVKPVFTRLTVQNKYVINFYEAPDVTMNYILSCDVAGGLGSDNSVMTIIAPDDFRVVGDFRSNKIDTDSFREFIREVMSFYFANAILLIERNSYGLNILQTLMKDPKIEPRMFREEKERPAEKKTSGGYVIKQKTKNIVYGIDTTSQKRDIMFNDILPILVQEEFQLVTSPHLYEDIKNLEVTKTGKIEHKKRKGMHDDSLMSYLIFRYAVANTRTFKDRFGIQSFPSSSNARTSSSVGNISRMNQLYEIDKRTESGQAFSNSDLFNILQDQEKKIALQEDQEKTKKQNLFDKISKWNL